MWTGLRIHYMYPIVEGRRREKRGREEGEWRKIGGGAKLEGAEMRKILRARLRKGGPEGRQGVGDTSLQCILFLKEREIFLAHRNYFFGFVLVDFTLLTWNSKKMFTNFYIFLNKRVYILYNVPIRQLCTYILKNIQEEDPPPPRFPLFHLYLLSKGVL